MKAKKLNKETVTLKDGRYLIYYSWANGSEDRGQKTEDRGERTEAEDGRQRTEDSRLKTEDRGQKTVKLYRNN